LLVEGDTVAVWSGGRSAVTVHHRREHTGVTRESFLRHSGMIDLLPAGTVLEQVEWSGQSQSCLSAELGDGVELGRADGATHCLDPERGALFGAVDAHIVDLVRRLEAHAIAGQPLGALYTEALSLTLFRYLRGQHALKLNEPLEAPTLSPSQRKRVIEFVEENLGRDIGLPELAELTGYSSDHFSRMFKRAMGLPAYQYLLARRIERVKCLLADPNRPIAEIAYACGFSTPAHLNSAFKQRTGLTPGAFRRR
jgi:AraC family transcriptional regulator